MADSVKQPIPVRTLLDLGMTPNEFSEMSQHSELSYVRQLALLRAGRSVSPLFILAQDLAGAA